MATRASSEALSELPELRDTLVLGVSRGHERRTFHQLADYRTQPGDAIVTITSEPGVPRAPDPKSPPPQLMTIPPRNRHPALQRPIEGSKHHAKKSDDSLP
jgi:hypothetical protein